MLPIIQLRGAVPFIPSKTAVSSKSGVTYAARWLSHKGPL